MKTNFKLLLLFAGIMTFVAATTIDKGFIGTWNYTIDTPDMTFEGQLIIKKDAKAYSGYMVSESGELALENVKVETDKLTFKINVQGYDCYTTLTLNGDAFKGNVEVEGQSFPMEGERKK